MAKFNVISVSDSTVIKYSGCPTYHGTYLQPAYLEFTTINSPTPINWAVGDYIVYTRTGLTYRLYSIPQPTKKAASGTSGESFSYSNVQFYADTKRLEVCPFRDLVIEQGTSTSYHFSTLNSVDTYETVEGIAARIQQNLVSFFGSGTWSVVVASGIPASFSVTEAREFSLSGGTCLDALDKIYEVWPELGWTYSLVNGVHTVTIGAPNVRSSGNTTNEFKYGIGQGLTLIKKSQQNKDEMATRLYAYGSSRNIISRYYNDKDIYEASKVYIPNLMLPLSSWGTTDSKPDASKAHLDDATAQAKYGIIPKYVYFDGSEQEEIYPSIEKATISDVRSAKTSQTTGAPNYYPASNYTGTERVDEVLSVTGLNDNGLTGEDGERIIESADESLAASYGNFTAASGDTEKKYNFNFSAHVFTHKGKMRFTCGDDITLSVVTSGLVSYISSVTAYYSVSGKTSEIQFGKSTEQLTAYTFSLPKIECGSASRLVTGSTQVIIHIVVEFTSAIPQAMQFRYSWPATTTHWELEQILTSTFEMTIRQIGFDMMERASLSGNGMPTIAFKDGACIARSFQVKSATYGANTDIWTLVVYRGDDTSVGMRYPNTTYPVAAGDHFVLLDLAMPDEYMGIASNRLLTAAQELFAELKEIEPFYEPSIDAKVIAQNIASNPGNEAYILREGKYMHITDSDVVGSASEYVLIDTLTINENESNIPTYAVTLREKKKKTVIQNIESQIESLTSVGSASSSGTTGETGQTKSAFVATGDYDSLANIPTIDNKEVVGVLSSYSDLGLINTDFFELDTTSIPGTPLIKAKYGLYTSGLLSAGGVSSGGASGTVTQIKIGTTAYNPDDDGIVSLPSYPTLSSLGAQAALVSGTNIKTINGESILGSGNITISGGGTTVSWGTEGTGYAPLTVGGVTKNLSLYGHTHDYLPLTGGTISGNLTVSGTLYAASIYSASGKALLMEGGNDISLGYGSGDTKATSIYGSSVNIYSGSRVIALGIASSAITAHKSVLPDGTISLGSSSALWNSLYVSKVYLGTSDYLQYSGDLKFNSNTIWHAGNSNKSDVDWSVKGISVENNIGLKGNITVADDANGPVCLGTDATNKYIILGYGTAEQGYDTYIDGNVLHLRAGSGHTEAVSIATSGINLKLDASAEGSLSVGGNLTLSESSDIRGAYLSIHPERQAHTNPLPFFSNDLAFLAERGGSAVLGTSGANTDSDISNCFDGSSAYFYFLTEFLSTEAEITITLPSDGYLKYGTLHYADFGNAGWGFTTVKIQKSTDGSSYTSLDGGSSYTTIDNSKGNSFVRAYDGATGETGVQKIRYTLSGGGSPYLKTITVGGVVYTHQGWTRTYNSQTYYAWYNSAADRYIYTTTEEIIATSGINTVYAYTFASEVMSYFGTVSDCSRHIIFTSGGTVCRCERYSSGDSGSYMAWKSVYDGSTIFYTLYDYKQAVGKQVYDSNETAISGVAVSHVMNGWYNHRIAEIGAVNYDSKLGRNTFMSRGCDDALYRSLTPAKDECYNLGSYSLRWNAINVKRWYPTSDRNIYIEYDSANSAFKVNGNIYATGWIAAGGVNNSQ